MVGKYPKRTPMTLRTAFLEETRSKHELHDVKVSEEPFRVLLENTNVSRKNILEKWFL
jgi:hypothetical protein